MTIRTFARSAQTVSWSAAAARKVLDGIVLTKLDSSAKGGFVISLCSQLQMTIRTFARSAQTVSWSAAAARKVSAAATVTVFPCEMK